MQDLQIPGKVLAKEKISHQQQKNLKMRMKTKRKQRDLGARQDDDSDELAKGIIVNSNG